MDHDGLPDGLEDAPGGLKDPNGAELPNLNAMGASIRPIGISSLNTTRCRRTRARHYGSAAAPYPNTTAACYDPSHRH